MSSPNNASRWTVALQSDPERTVSVDAARAGSSWLTIELAGKRHSVRVLRPGPEALVLVDGRVLSLGVTPHKGGVRCDFAGSSWGIEVNPANKLRASRGAAAKSQIAGSGWLEAPMPGRVVQVSVSVGASVAAGDSLLVLEAMKMQNDVFCSVRGRISAIAVSAGDAVERGARLLQIVADE